MLYLLYTYHCVYPGIIGDLKHDGQRLLVGEQRERITLIAESKQTRLIHPVNRDTFQLFFTSCIKNSH